LIHVSELSAETRHDDLMLSTTRRTLIRFGLCVAALLPANESWADPDRDHDRARRAVQRGEALPLFDIIARVRTDLGGEVVGVSFKRKRDRWVYEFKVVGGRGELTEVYVDAASAEILKREEH
jgi:uncharacterized membrane protein YkoI